MNSKFKLTESTKVHLHNAPDNFLLDGVTQATTKPFDRVIAFVFSIEELTAYLQYCIDHQLVTEQGYLFFVYPKKGNKTYDTYIHRDAIFPAITVDEQKYIAGSDYKFATLSSLDDTFSILSIKVDNKQKGKKKTAKSQCVDDYIQMIPQLKETLSTDPKLLSFYESLTPGYQKDWARYVYSAKREDTQKNRLEEMKDILGQGFKTKELFRQAQKKNS
ncbi:YdeI/OmpD-associated family protein [Rummeliibacillus pycnus]|uniref:YdeI/OmpD-associated family protein n=1 Tax=Rummeliibacillus pycnus TaxID=101070 RepID=UPI0037CB42BB